MRMKVFPLLAAVLLAALPLRAQTNPTGTISGKVVDPDGLAVPGVTVTAESPALQGARDHDQLPERRLHHSVPPRRRLHRDLHAARVQDGEADDAGLADGERHPQPDAGREHGE